MIYQISVNDIKIDHSGSKWIGTENGLWVYNEKWQNVLKIKEPSYDNGMAFRLEQNSPNPFTGSTLIRYRLPVYCRVTLKVYNALGREVRTLVDEQQHAGTYSVVFNAGNLPEGVYYCRLQSGEYYDTRKFLLLK
jgi:hypothetical protein